MTQNSHYKTQNQKKLTSFDQDKIKVLCDNLCDNIEDLLDHFDLEYNFNNRFITMACPIHLGDNTSALNLYHIGDNYRGNWKCRTHQCEETFKGSIIGFIRGIISQRKYNWTKPGDKMCSFQEALDYCYKFFNVASLDDIKIDKSLKEKNSFVRNVNILSHRTKDQVRLVKRESVIRNYKVSQYFLKRGFSEEILKKYDVFDCYDPTKEMNNRAVVPIYDMYHSHMVGCTGRSVFDSCPKCKKFYHSPNTACPTEDLWKYSKWKHNYGFQAEDNLYNYWYAKKYIEDSGTVILVESPGNVWRLEENGIHNSLAIFGSNFTDKQKILLDSSGAMTIISIMDNDQAGELAYEKLHEKCHKTYNIKKITISKGDIAEMTPEEIKKEINSYL